MIARSRHCPALRRVVPPGVTAAIVTLAILALAAPALCQQAPPQHPPAAAPPAAAPAPAPPSVPVTLDGEVLYYVHHALGTLSPEERASVVERRLVRIADDPFYSTSEISVAPTGKNAEIYYRGKLVGLVTAEEAATLGEGTAVEEANRLVARIARAIEDYRARRQPQAVRRAAILALLATLLLAAALELLRRGNRGLVARVQASTTAAQGPGVMKTMVRSLDKTTSLQRRGLRLLRVLLTVLIVAVYLLTIFDLFPLTRAYVKSIADYFFQPFRIVAAGIWDNVGNFIFIVVIAVLSRYLLKALRLLLSETAAGNIALPGVQAEWAMLLYKAIRIIVVAVTAVMVYPYVPGSDSEAFKGISLFAGALFTLGASGLAGNMIGGLALSFSGTFHLGDRVKVGDVTGDVLQITLLLTRIRSLNNEVVTIPNSAIMTGHVVNYSAMARTKGLILTTEITIGYDAPWRKVHALMIDAALRTTHILAEPAPFVVQKSLNDYHVSYTIWAYTSEASLMVTIYGELHQNIQDAFNEAGVEILSPAFNSLRDGNTTTVPRAYRADGYKPEPFKLQVERAAPTPPHEEQTP